MRTAEEIADLDHCRQRIMALNSGRLPDDVQQMVDDGWMDDEAARELIEVPTRDREAVLKTAWELAQSEMKQANES